jgi:hypothetical protein
LGSTEGRGRFMTNASKFIPLTGVVAVVLIVVSLIVSGETPDTDDPLEEVVTFYTENDSEQMASGILLGFGSLFFLFFATALRNALRRAERDGAGASTLSFGGAIVFAVGASIFAGLTFTLGDAVDDIEPPALQTLHVLNNDMFLTVAVGLFAFLLGSGIAVVRTGVLPAWLGWVAIVVSVLSITPIFFIAFAVMGLWVLVVSVMLTLAADGAPSPTAPPPSTGPPPSSAQGP